LKIWGSIEQAAEELDISTRSVYRRIGDGRIQKRRGKGGGWIYVSDNDDSDVPGDVPETSTVDVNDIASMSLRDKKRGGEKGDLVNLQSVKPSHELVKDWEKTKQAGLILERKKYERETEALTSSSVHPAVKEKRASLDILQMSVDEMKVQRELKELMRDEDEASLKIKRRERIHKIKDAAISPLLRKNIPAPILLSTLALIDAALGEIPDLDNFDDESLKLQVDIAISNFWSHKNISPSIRTAKLRTIWQGIDDTFEAARKQAGFPTVDHLLNDWLQRNPVETTKMIYEILDFGRFCGIRT
jgi:hypothetical protein